MNRVRIRDQSFLARRPPHHHSFWDRAAAGSWEPETFTVLDHVLRPGALYIDIGAWVGPTVLYAASLGARVVAFEPDPVSLEELRLNVSANEHLREEIRIEPVAISTSTGVRELYAINHGDSMSRFNRDWKRRDGVIRLENFVECKTIEAMSAAEEYGFADAVLIKMDVEGHEYELIPHLTEFFRSSDAALFLSLHPNSIGNDDDDPRAMRTKATLDVLDALDGYRIFTCADAAVSELAPERLRQKVSDDGGAWGPFLFSR